MAFTYDAPYSVVEPQQVRDDMHDMAMDMSHEQLANLVSTFFRTEQLAELIDDRMMGRV